MLAAERTLTDQGVKFGGIDGNIHLLGDVIECQKASVVTSVKIFVSGIAQTHDQMGHRTLRRGRLRRNLTKQVKNICHVCSFRWGA